MKVLVTGVRAPAGVHVAQCIKGGVVTGDCIRYPLVPSQQFPSPEYAFQEFTDWMVRFSRQRELDWVVPTGEDVIHTKQAFEDMGDGDRVFAPPSDMLVRMHDKLRFAHTMRDWGFEVPDTMRIEDWQDCGHEPHDWVFKPIFSRFATQVLVGPERAPKVKAQWIAQARCRGIECCVYAVCFEGRLLGFQAYRPIVRVGRGAGIGLRPVSIPGLREQLEAFAGKSDWTGQVSFDFFYDKGRVVFIECNPRATSGVHWFEELTPMLSGGAVVPTRRDMLKVSAAVSVFGGRGPRVSVLERASDVFLSKVGVGVQLRTTGELMVRGALKGKEMLGGATWGIVHDEA